MSRPIQPNYPGVSYVSAATGSPLLSSHSSLLSQQQSAAVVQQQQHHQLAGLTMTGHHGLSSSGSISVGPSHQPQLSASAGASSAGGLFYSQSSGFAPHHSPFAPCKYPMVPPDSYRFAYSKISISSFYAAGLTFQAYQALAFGRFAIPSE